MDDQNKTNNSNEQEDMYAAFNQQTQNNNVNNNMDNNVNSVNNNVNNNINNVENTPYQYQEKQYNTNYLEKNTVVTRASKASRVLLCGFYLLIILIVGVVFLLLRADRYEFYLVKDEVNLGDGGSYQVEITPKNVHYFNYKNYSYEIEDESIATVDKLGKVTAVSGGETKLRVSLSPGLVTKTMKIVCSDVEIKSITLLNSQDNSSKTINMEADQTVTLKAIINDQENLITTVEYTSSDSSVADVDEFGNVTAISAGTAVITGERYGIKGSITIKVTGESSFDPYDEPYDEPDDEPYDEPYDEPDDEPSDETEDQTISVTSVSLNNSKITLNIGGSKRLKANIVPTDATNKEVTWVSSDEKIATVSKTGVVKGVKAGTATITVKTSDGSKTAKCTVTVNEQTAATVKVTSVTLDKSTETVTVGKTVSLVATVSPDNATNQEVNWKSSDKSIATVDDKGVVTGVKAGTATITVKTSDGNKTAKCTVTVKNKTVAVKSVSLDKTKLSLAVGKTSTLKTTVKPDNATNKKVTWKSSDEKIATVNKSGVVKGIAVGKATITVTTNSGKKTATSEVEITQGKNPMTVTSPQSWDVATTSSDKTKNFTAPKNAQGSVTYSIHEQKDSNDAKVSYFSIPTKTKATLKMKANTPKGTYKVTIYAKAAGNTNYRPLNLAITMNVKVTESSTTSDVKITKIEFEKEQYEKSVDAKAFTIKPKLTPSDASTSKLTWKSSDEKVATVTKSGKVTPKSEGTAVITASADGKEGSYILYVREKTPDGVQVKASEFTLSPLSLTIDKGKTKSFTIKVKNSACVITVKSSDKKTATVSSSSADYNASNGKAVIDYSGEGKETTMTFDVKGVKKGTAYINISDIDCTRSDMTSYDGSGKIGILVK